MHFTSEAAWGGEVVGVGAKLSDFTSSEGVLEMVKGSLGGRGDRGRVSLSPVEGSITSL